MTSDSNSAMKTAKKLSGYSGLTFLASLFFLLCWGVGSLVGSGGFFKALFFISLFASIGCWVFSKVMKSQSKSLAEEERRRDEAERQERAEQARKDAEARERDYTLQRLKSVHQRASSLAQSIPALIQAAKSNLDMAEQEYQRGAFSPFWEGIEGATMRLGELADNLHQFGQLTDDQKQIDSELQSKYRLYADSFPVQLPDIYKAEEGQLVAQRMDTMVSRAQTDYRFSTIYEQRRTNSILIAGFSSLGNAIVGMTAKLTDELESVVRSVDSTRASVDRTQSSIDSASSMAGAQSAEALRMLDNIQRRRLPYGQTSREY